MRVLVAVGLALALVGCAPASSWTELRSVDDLKEAFNRDRGDVRLVLLLSPT